VVEPGLDHEPGSARDPAAHDLDNFASPEISYFPLICCALIQTPWEEQCR
jgi:hypothetical protein